MVYLHMPDYREDHAPPLDVVGLVLFGSGIGLLSYVLEVFGEHKLSPIEITGLLSNSSFLPLRRVKYQGDTHTKATRRQLRQRSAEHLSDSSASFQGVLVNGM